MLFSIYQSNRYPFSRALIGSRKSRYPRLVYTKTVISIEGALWLASQTSNILCYLPPSYSKIMASQFASVTSKEIIQINYEAVPKNTKKATKFGVAMFKSIALCF